MAVAVADHPQRRRGPHPAQRPAWRAWRPRTGWPAALAAAGFLLLHAGVHVGETLAGICGWTALLRDAPLVILPALLALALALGEAGVYALSAGSDGIDGSSEAAGAFLTPDTLARAHELGLDAAEFLTRNDSGTFFARLGDALVTGPSGHNLNDFRALAVGWSVWGAAGVTPTVTN